MREMKQEMKNIWHTSNAIEIFIYVKSVSHFGHLLTLLPNVLLLDTGHVNLDMVHIWKKATGSQFLSKPEDN